MTFQSTPPPAVDLPGKVAIVTGSGRGLGLAYAKELAVAGASVVINDVDVTAADAAVATITGAGGRAVAVVEPVGSTASAKVLVQAAIEHFGRLDALVTNAGILRDKVLWKMTDEDFDAVIDVHLRGTFTCVREAAIQMRAQGDGGRIVCIGSPAGQRGNFGQTNYSAAKAAIVGMVRTWSMELSRSAITVNAVCPVAATAMTETIPFLAPHVDAMRRGESLPPIIRRGVGMGTPEDAAGLVAYLLSDAAADITGQAFSIGGDRLALWTHPELVHTQFHDGGWSRSDIATAWPQLYAGHLQSVGEEFPAELLGR